MLHVAVAVIRDHSGRILLSRRQHDQHLAGLWEFPGGKLETAESLGDALRREIDEELGLEVISHRPLIQVRHRYPDRQVLLDVHLVEEWRGEACGREGQEIAWVTPDSLPNYPLPPADRPIVTALALPCRYLITPEEISLDALLQRLDRLDVAAATQHRLLLQLRLPGRSANEVAEIANQLCSRYQGLDLLVKDVALAQQLGCGVHLRAADLMAIEKRPLPSGQWMAASCHSRAELQQAARLDADFVTLSPVKKTSSHPHSEVLGWDAFVALNEAVSLPVYALGGLDESDMTTAWNAGAQGIAGISGIWPSGSGGCS